MRLHRGKLASKNSSAISDVNWGGGEGIPPTDIQSVINYGEEMYSWDRVARRVQLEAQLVAFSGHPGGRGQVAEKGESETSGGQQPAVADPVTGSRPYGV